MSVLGKRKYMNYGVTVLPVLVRNPEGRIRLYCKGADMVLFERLRPCNQELMSITSDHLNVSSRGDAWGCAATWCPQTDRQTAQQRQLPPRTVVDILR